MSVKKKHKMGKKIKFNIVIIFKIDLDFKIIIIKLYKFTLIY